MVIAALALLPGLLPAQEQAQPKQQYEDKTIVSVERIAVAPSLENKEPAGEALSFPAETANLFCWTLVKARPAPAKIKHAWYLNGEKKFEIALPIANSPYRTWSNKNVSPGQWKVEVTADDEVIKTIEFTVAEPPQTPAQQSAQIPETK